MHNKLNIVLKEIIMDLMLHQIPMLSASSSLGGNTRTWHISPWSDQPPSCSNKYLAYFILMIRIRHSSTIWPFECFLVISPFLCFLFIQRDPWFHFLYVVKNEFIDGINLCICWSTQEFKENDMRSNIYYQLQCKQFLCTNYLCVPCSNYNAYLNCNKYYIFIDAWVIKRMTLHFFRIFIGAFVPIYVGIWTSFSHWGYWWWTSNTRLWSGGQVQPI